MRKVIGPTVQLLVGYTYMYVCSNKQGWQKASLNG